MCLIIWSFLKHFNFFIDLDKKNQICGRASLLFPAHLGPNSTLFFQFKSHRILLSLGCHSKIGQTVQLNNRYLLFDGSGGWTVQDQGLAGLGFWWEPFPGLKNGYLLAVMLTWSGGERDWERTSTWAKQAPSCIFWCLFS